MIGANNKMSESLAEQVNRPRSNSAVGKKKGVSRFRRAALTPWALFLIWAPLAVVLVWAVITRSMAAYLANTQPEIALQLTSSVAALVNFAGDELNRAQGGLNSPASAKLDPEAVTRIRSRAEQALRNDPLNARAFRILGELSYGDADEKRTETLMQAAARRSLHESSAVYWLMQKSFQDQQYQVASRYAEVLCMTRDLDRYRLTGPVFSVLAKVAELEGPRGELVQLL